MTVIGGQAVNYWCEQAHQKNPELEAHYPFTSEDLDVVARQKAQTLAIAEATGLKFVEMDQGYAGIDRAAFVDENGETVIQVLGGMYGVMDKDLERDTAQVLVQAPNGEEKIAKIANRTVLIKGKIALALAPDGVRGPEDKEHDRFHLKLLILCVALATKEMVENIDGKGRTERDVIKSLKALLKVVCSDDARKVSAIDPTVDWKRTIAPEVLLADKVRYPKLSHFGDNEIFPWINAFGPAAF